MPAGWLGRLFGGTIQETVGYGVGTAVSDALAPESQALRNEVWPHTPNVPLTPDILAAMAVQGVMQEEDAATEALMSGVSTERFHKLYRVNGNPIAPEEALDLWNRGELNEEDVSRALLQSRLKPEWVDKFKLLRRRILQLGELAEMVVQSVITEPEGATAAARLGVDSEEFGKLVRVTGNPPGPQDTLSLWNRHIFTEAEATLALRQSRLKPEWIEKFKESRIRPPSTSDAVRSVIKERMTMAEGIDIAAQNGLSAVSFRNLVEAAGRPIGIQQALQLYNRKHYNAADVRKVVAYSDVRTEFVPDILKLAVRYPSILQVRQLVQHGSIDDAYAIELLVEQGYPHRLAEDVVGAGHNTKTQPEKDLAKTEIAQLFHAGAISREAAAGLLKELGYDDSEAGYILDLAEFRRIAKYLEAAIGRVHNQYVNHRIGTDVVTTELDHLGVPTDQREQLLDLWKEERLANVKILTPAQIVRAFKKGFLKEEDAVVKLVDQGYADDDASLLLSI